MTLAISASLDPASITSAIREQILALDKDVTLYNVATMEQLVSNSVAQPRLNLSLLAAFAALALVLAAVGIYGVMAFAVAKRTQGIGIRLALGAMARDAFKLALAEGGRLVLLSLAFGVVATLALTRLMASLLFGVSASDPLTLVVAAGLLALVALAACYIPADAPPVSIPWSLCDMSNALRKSRQPSSKSD